ncbi:hypothetical protein BU15DRAFT_56478 [Melanogaster broomeanus]|nr:hypothetical protein BU15DRAFT_56478 [Melanogaster broomeanus]
MVQTRSTTNKLQTRGAQKATTSTGTYTTESKASTSPQDGDSDDPVVQVPAKKRSKGTQEKHRRAAQSSQKSRRGRLEMLPELNLDVLFQILGFLHPMDLLNLARTTKAFRQLLMRKSSAFVWKAALGRVEGLPACPPDLNEPQYAYLAFYPHCHVSAMELLDPTQFLTVVASMSRYFLKGSNSCADKFAGRGYIRFVDIRRLAAFEKEYKEVPQDRRDQFLAVRRHQVCAIDEVRSFFLLIPSQHASKCEAWHEDIVQARKDELRKAKLARAKSIFTRLKDLGYTSELNYCGTGPIENAHRSIFNSTKALTDQEWVCARQQLETTMNDCRTRRLESAVYNPRRKLLVELYNTYVRQPAPSSAIVDLLPDVVDLVHFAAFDAIIKLPEGITVNAETFKPAFEQIPTLAQEWRTDVDAQLAALVVIPGDSSTSGVAKEDDFSDGMLKPAEPLKLASAVFEDRSDDLMVSIDLLNQWVFNRCFSDSIASRVIPGRPWSLMDDFGPLVKCFTGAAHVVRACGMDPRTATVEDMDKRDIRLGCNYCPHKTPKMNWRTAVSLLVHSQ